MNVPAKSHPPIIECSNPALLLKMGSLIDVVGAQDLTTVVAAARFVVLEVPRVADRLKIGVGQVDVVRVGVVQLAAEAPFVLNTKTCLEAVVGPNWWCSPSWVMPLSPRKCGTRWLPGLLKLAPL
jgi:hypothetical protein